MVWSRCGRRLPSQPLISRSTSGSVRYSRVRTSAFLGRRGVLTFRIWCLAIRFSRLVLAYESVLLLQLLSVKDAKYGKFAMVIYWTKLDRGRQKGPVGDRGHGCVTARPCRSGAGQDPPDLDPLEPRDIQQRSALLGSSFSFSSFAARIASSSAG